MSRFSAIGQRGLWVAGILAAIGLLDVTVGLYLLLSATPWNAHGPATVWQNAASILQGLPDSQATLLSLYRRMGAFSLHAGVVTIVWAWLGLTNRRAMSALLITYSITGLGFFYCDAAFFDGTRYLQFKQGISVFWLAALALQFWPARVAEKGPPGLTH